MKIIYSPVEEPLYLYPFLHPKENMAFFDIETTGLSPNASSLYLIGLMTYDSIKKKWLLCQWFADNYQSEKEILQNFIDALANVKYLYHFNGKTFDIPYILKKCTRHALIIPKHCQKLFHDTTGQHSIDLLSIIRSLRHALRLEKCSQTTVEQWLGLKRSDPFSGNELITVYSEYMQQKLLNPENAKKLEKVLLLHNHDDIEMMLNLCSLFTYHEYLSENCQIRLLAAQNLSTLEVLRTQKQELSLSIKLPAAVPKAIHLTAPFPPESADREIPAIKSPATLSMEEDTARISLPLYEGTLKFFLPDYRDYYYLMKEDMAVHKSIAEFVDSTVRKKATAATCYIKQTGLFLPSLVPSGKRKISAAPDIETDGSLSLFHLQWKDKLSFFKLPNDYTKNLEFWKQYLNIQFPCFRNI